MKGIYVIATGQHVGKTTVSLGLISYLASMGLRVGFFKPVGQEYILKGELKVDKDALLMQSATRIAGSLEDMSPVTVPSGFVENYLFNRDAAPNKKRILEAYENLSAQCDVVVAEGTGHAGVGACFDLSNADVAEMLGLRVLLISEGGIGSALDQVALNVSLFRNKNIRILGVLANKVIPDKLDRIKKALAQGLSNMGLGFLGAIPFEPRITYPQVGQIAKTLGAEILCGEKSLNRRVESVLVAAMEPQNLIPWIVPHSLMITPGDRIDNILVALSSGLLEEGGENRIVGLALTGGLIPHFTVISLMKKSGLPVLMSKEDTYSVSNKVQKMVCKILPEDEDKITVAQELVKNHLDLEGILAAVMQE